MREEEEIRGDGRQERRGEMTEAEGRENGWRSSHLCPRSCQIQ